MNKQNRKTIGYITPFIWGDISLGYFKGALEVAKKKDINIICYIGQRLEDQKDFNYQANAIYEHMDASWMDGLIVWASQIGELLSSPNGETIEAYFPKVPMVTMAGRIGTHPYILTNDDVSIYQLVEHLVVYHGYKKIGFVRGPVKHALAKGRYDAYKHAMKAQGIEVEDNWVTKPGPFIDETGIQAMDTYEKLWPHKVHEHLDAIICSSDAFAKTLTDRSIELGYEIPTDFALVGINNKPHSRLTKPPLTTVDPRIRGVGNLAAITLMKQFSKEEVPHVQYVDPILTIRKSCGCTEEHIQLHYVNGNIDLDFFLSEEELTEGERLSVKLLFSDIVKGSEIGGEEQIIDDLVESLSSSLYQQKDKPFIYVWRNLMNRLKDSNENLDIWETFLTQISIRLVEHIKDLDKMKFLQNLINQARVDISEALEYQLAGNQNKVDKMLRVINQTNASLRTAHEYKELTQLFANLLPEFGIPGCCIVIYEEGAKRQKGNVVFLYQDGKVIESVNEGPFNTTQLLPDGFMNRDKGTCLFAQSLYYREKNFGYIIFEAGPIDKSIYTILATELSGSIYRSQLFSSLMDMEVERIDLLHELEEKNANLEKRIEERTKDLRQVNLQLKKATQEAQNANQAKSQFLANISHEIRTPLNCIIGFADMIQAISKDDTVIRYIGMTIEETEKLLLLINQLLDLSKIEAGKFQLNMEPISIEVLLESLTSTFTVVANAKGLQFEYLLDPGMPKVFKADDLRLRQVLVNLIGNAIKFTEKGKVRVVVKSSGDDSIDFEIHDTGIGIEASRVDDIFRLFEQESSNTSKHYGGTGLGTAISKQLVELMGGTIWVESAKNIGSTFSFKIPVEPLSPLELESYESHVRNEQNQVFEYEKFLDRHILIVEDYPPNRMLATAYLAPLGVQISHANNGQEAIDMLEKKQYDLILMDVQMPILDGVEATKHIRSVYGYHKHIIIGMTANAYESDLMTYRNIGMDDVITKPFRKAAMLNLVSKWLIDKEKVSSKVYQSLDNQEGLPYNHHQMLKELGGDEKLLDELLTDFIHHTKINLEKLSKAIDAQNLEEVRFIAHTIKGASLNMTANIIGELTLSIENEAKKESADNLPSLMETLKTQFEQLNQYLEKPIED